MKSVTKRIVTMTIFLDGFIIKRLPEIVKGFKHTFLNFQYFTHKGIIAL